ncbi:unnamed protein product [Vitrella brassicaformis CCMP3155]|uniref:Uncharacterized protein n=1 Tax=Vitrella brassicaformis (strain CCMP3155) TaxID=1169540 RepID=A0A0G4H598_VITBC|nr:unnamed protein product [Vitrella brassicaformis CCMP3155]|eukprot:CEM38961.1 unnamed protein product [Vitrella brassicaformis CCMP3155]
MDLESAGGPASPTEGRGGRQDRDDSLSDVIDKIHSVASQIASTAEAAKLKIPDAHKTVQACASLAGRLSGVVETLTDAHSTLSNELAQIPPNTQNNERTDGDGRLVRWLYNIHDEASKAAYLSKAVSAGDGKGSQVGASPAAAAAASSGGFSEDSSFLPSYRTHRKYLLQKVTRAPTAIICTLPIHLSHSDRCGQLRPDWFRSACWALATSRGEVDRHCQLRQGCRCGVRERPSRHKQNDARRNEEAEAHRQLRIAAQWRSHRQSPSSSGSSSCLLVTGSAHAWPPAQLLGGSTGARDGV